MPLYESEMSHNHLIITTKPCKISIKIDFSNQLWFILAQLSDALNARNAYLTCPREVIFHIMSFLLEVSSQDRIEHAANFAACMIRPSLFHSVQNMMFPDFIKAIMNADMPVVLFMMQKNPAFMDMTTALHGQTVSPFQMAFCLGDIALCDQMALRCNVRDIKTQVCELIGDNHHLFIETQRQGAIDFFDSCGIEAAFHLAASSPTTPIQLKKAEIQEKLELPAHRFHQTHHDYLKNHPVYNPFLIMMAFEMYERNYHAWSIDQITFFLKKIIYPLQQKSPPVWYQYFAQGIYFLAYKNEPFRRDFLLRDVTTDIRSIMEDNQGTYINLFAQNTRYPAPEKMSGDSYTQFIENRYLRLFVEFCKRFTSPTIPRR